ncbi:hepatic lectin-like [Malurus melanocephalus]|uniref:hepatic lectin-like n=1 Tax=Malurus melanocephalus TaxID=175006 RepID=UPI002549BAF0|nr:hepatic lectin-like [Malurus melanocephalus]
MDEDEEPRDDLRPYRVSSVSSKLSREHLERNFSDWDSFLFPCGADSRDWEYFSGNCYYFSLARTSWERARERCRERGAQLAVIGGFPEQVGTKSDWEWVDGSDYGSSFTFWKEGEPNNSGNNEDCAHLWIWGQWNDVHCTFECYFICERPLTPKSQISH